MELPNEVVFENSIGCVSRCGVADIFCDFRNRCHNAAECNMRLLRLFLLISLLGCPALAENVVLINGIILDGTGKARFTGNVRIRDGKITDIGLFKPNAGETLLDVRGLILAPGFIDLENLSVAELEKDTAATSAIARGVTTAILGGDGN